MIDTNDQDKQAVTRCLHGDKQGFGELIQRYRGPVVRLLTRITRNPDTAMDLSQDVFLKVYKALPGYNPQYRFSQWLFKIATNTALDALRKKSPQLLSDPEDLDRTGESGGFAGSPVSPAVAAEQDQLRTALGNALNRLPVKYRVAVWLRYQQELSYQEIADVLDVPLGTAKVQVHRGLKLLQPILRQWHMEGRDK